VSLLEVVGPIVEPLDPDLGVVGAVAEELVPVARREDLDESIRCVAGVPHRVRDPARLQQVVAGPSDGLVIGDTDAHLAGEDVDPHVVARVDVACDQVARLHGLFDERDDAVRRFVRDDDACSVRSDVNPRHERDGIDGVIVDCDMRKWGDIAHWRFPVELLGRDAFGTWLGAVPPTAYTGPRGAGEWTHNFVMCVPDDAWWIATFNAVTTEVGAEVYVDMTTPPVWLSGSHVQAIDLDLDVIRERDGTVFIDDEDEFEEHKVKFAYPADVVAAARASCDEIFRRVRSRDEPFGDVGRTWLATRRDSA
jgi:hypothetical protein